MRQQRVSDLGKWLNKPGDAYRVRLLGAAYTAAMLDDGHGHHAQGDEYGTPAPIVEIVRAFYGGQIDCDPASNETAQKTVRAIQYFTKEQDGLKQQWLGTTFLNGPYSDLAPWVEKLISEYEAGHVTEAIVLTNAAVGTEWFNLLLDAAAGACILRDRVRFLLNGEARNSPMTGQMLFYLGPRFREFTEAFRPLGSVVRTVA
jgi:DNA N-6-adenine-methyltransferase (Dam)